MKEECDWCWKKELTDIPFELPRECNGCEIDTKTFLKNGQEILLLYLLEAKP